MDCATDMGRREWLGKPRYITLKPLKTAIASATSGAELVTISGFSDTYRGPTPQPLQLSGSAAGMMGNWSVRRVTLPVS